MPAVRRGGLGLSWVDAPFPRRRVVATVQLARPGSGGVWGLPPSGSGTSTTPRPPTEPAGRSGWTRHSPRSTADQRVVPAQLAGGGGARAGGRRRPRLSTAGPFILAVWYEPAAVFEAAYRVSDVDHFEGPVEGEIGQPVRTSSRRPPAFRCSATDTAAPGTARPTTDHTWARRGRSSGPGAGRSRLRRAGSGRPWRPPTSYPPPW